MTHEQKLAEKAAIESALEEAMQKTRSTWLALQQVLKRLDPVTAAAITDLWLQWIADDEAANDLVNKLHRINDRITKQSQFPTPETHPGTIAGPPATMKNVTTGKSTHVSPK